MFTRLFMHTCNYMCANGYVYVFAKPLCHEGAGEGVCGYQTKLTSRRA